MLDWPLLHPHVPPECHEVFHDALFGFLRRGVPQQGIETQLVAFGFRTGLALGCADFAGHDGWCWIPANYHEFDHGYAVTAHRSQGKTVDAVILSADAMKQELFYVGASRGRQEIVVVTSDREQLREMLGISTARPSVTELAREQAQLHSAPMLNPERPPMQTIEPSLLRKKDGHKYDLGMSR